MRSLFFIAKADCGIAICGGRAANCLLIFVVMLCSAGTGGAPTESASAREEQTFFEAMDRWFGTEYVEQDQVTSLKAITLLAERGLERAES